MPADENDLSPEEFIKKMDAGDFDGHVAEEIRKLPSERLERVANLLIERDSKRWNSPRRK